MTPRNYGRRYHLSFALCSHPGNGDTGKTDSIWYNDFLHAHRGTSQTIVRTDPNAASISDCMVRAFRQCRCIHLDTGNHTGNHYPVSKDQPGNLVKINLVDLNSYYITQTAKRSLTAASLLHAWVNLTCHVSEYRSFKMLRDRM